MCSNIPDTPAYGVCISQLIRYARASSNYSDFLKHHLHLRNRLLDQGYTKIRLIRSLKKFIARTWELQDFIQNDDMNDYFNECPVPPNYAPEKPIIRNQLDKMSNYHRNLLISLCKAMQLKL
jgi:hypothetical protein